MEVEEYSNSSRLHLAGDSSVVVESFYQTEGGIKSAAKMQLEVFVKTKYNFFYNYSEIDE